MSISAVEAPESRSQWFGRVITECFPDCFASRLLSCLRCFCCTTELLSPNDWLKREFSKMVLVPKEHSESAARLVQAVFKKDPSRLARSEDVFSRVANSILMLDLSETNFHMIDTSDGSTDDFKPCPKIGRLCAYFPHLTDLTLSNCNIGSPKYEGWFPECADDCLKEIGKLTGLRRLDLSYNNITNKSLLQLVSLTKLGDLNLTGCTKVDQVAVAALQQKIVTLKVINNLSERKLLDP
jgi:Leucine-rich repeat (LRR) protein